MQVLTTKLKMGQLIIKILQDKLISKVSEPMATENLPSCVNFNFQAKNNSESGSKSGWIEFHRNNHKTKLLKKTSRCLKQPTPYIPLNDNRFATLTFKRQIKTHLPFAGIIRSSPYSPRFQDKG